MEYVQEAPKRILNMFLGKNVHFRLAVKPLKPESDGLTEVDCMLKLFSLPKFVKVQVVKIGLSDS